MVTEQTIRELIDSTTRELNAIGYSPVKIRSIRFDNARTCFAHVDIYAHTLTFSNHFREAPLPQIEATIMHEMIHMCPEAGHGHGAAWKFIAAKVNQTYPKYNIHRCGNNSNIIKEDWPLRTVGLKSDVVGALVCNECGHVYHVSKRSRAYREYMDCHCSICHGSLTKAK